MNGLRVTKLMSTAAQVSWNRLSCREHSGAAVGYTYELSRCLQHSQPALTVMFGIINDTSLDWNNLVPFTNYTVNIRFDNHMYTGPWSTLDFVTFEDCEYLILIAELLRGLVVLYNFENSCYCYIFAVIHILLICS